MSAPAPEANNYSKQNNGLWKLALSTTMTDELVNGLDTLPDVPLLNVFSYLGIKERLICSQVCRKWHNLIFTPSLWRTLNITCEDGRWDRNKMNCYDSQNCCELCTERRWLLLDGGYLRIVDSTHTLLDIVFEHIKKEMPLYKQVINEYRLLIGCLENILPKIGPSVKNLFLNANSGVSDFIFNLYIILCPNVERLDARFTALSSKAFQGLSGYGSCHKITELNLMGCKRVTDATLWNLVECWNKGTMGSSKDTSEKSIEVPYCAVYVHDVYSGFITVDDYVSETCDIDPYKRNIMTFLCPSNNDSLSSGLKFLSLAGCSQLTDKGLEYLANCKYVSSLELLDFSGCSGLTSKGLNLLTKACPQLKPYNLFYCDLISDGPFSEEANGCQTEGGECCMN